MAQIDSPRAWVPQELVEFYEQHAARYRQLAPREFEDEVAKVLASALTIIFIPLPAWLETCTPFAPQGYYCSCA
jgi:hypothetical protein